MDLKKSIIRVLKFFIGVIALSVIANADATDDLRKVSATFFAEEGIFVKESSRLLNNTTEVDQALVNLEQKLLIPHQANTMVQNLDKSMTTVELGLTALEFIPQTKVQAQQFKRSLQAAHKPVSSMATTLQKIDNTIVPLINAVDKAEKVAIQTMDAEERFRNVGIRYSDLLANLISCEHGEISLKAVNSSLPIYQDIDGKLKIVNDKYDEAKKVPYEAIGFITKEMKIVADFAKPAMEINAQLAPLNSVLGEIRVVLDKQIGLPASVPYVCGVKMCSQQVSYPCGFRTCKRSCGFIDCPFQCPNFCTKEVPYPCGPQTCNVDLSISVADALKGADEIEKIIESKVSGVAFQALKTVGLGNIISQLQNQAQNMIKPLLSKLNLNIDLNLPDPNLNISYDKLVQAKSLIDTLGGSIGDMGMSISIDNAFKPEVSALMAISSKIKPILDACPKTTQYQEPIKPAVEPRFDFKLIVPAMGIKQF